MIDKDGQYTETNYSSVGVTKKNLRYTVSKSTQYASATASVAATGGDREAAADLVKRRVRRAYIERFGKIDWDNATETYVHSTIQVTYELRVAPWDF